MSSTAGPSIATSGLVLGIDMSNTQKSWLGAPTTNLTPDMGIVAIQVAPTLTYIGVEDGWKKYSLNGTWTAGTYPYSVAVDAITFTGGVTYSTGVYIKTNVPTKFAALFTGMNYVNQPMNNAGTSFSITQADGSIFVGRTGFQYTSTTGQNGYLVSQPVVSQAFSSATDFIYIKQGQIEVGSFPTPFIAGTRSTTQAIVDLTSNNTITATQLTYAANNTFSFNGGTDSAYISNTMKIPNNSFTVSAWVNSSAVSGAQNILSMNGPYFMRITGSTVRFNVLAGGTWLFQQGTTVLSNNTWYYLTMVYNYTASTWAGYINNVLEFSVAKSGTLSVTSFYGYIGYTPQGGEQAAFNGTIGTIQVYNRALSAGEVAQNFNATRSRYGL